MVRPDPVEERVRRALGEMGVAYEALDCDPDFADTAAFCARYGIDPADSANTIIVASKKAPKRHAACVVLATTRLDVNGTARRRLGVSKASFASAEETAALTGMMIGGVTPFALPAGLAVWVDPAVMDRPEVVVGGGSRSLKIRVGPEVFTALGGEVVEGLAVPRAAGPADL